MATGNRPPKRPRPGPPEETPPTTRQQSARSKQGGAAADEATAQPAGGSPAPAALRFTLSVRWHSPHGEKTMMHHLALRPTDGTGLEGLRGFTEQLLKRAYPSDPSGARDLPAPMTSDAYLRFTPATKDYLQLPGDLGDTEFRLVAHDDSGWDFCVLHRRLGDFGDSGNDLVVTVVEFEGAPAAFASLGLSMRMRMVAYPLIAVKKEFLERTQCSLRTDPSFRGVL